MLEIVTKAYKDWFKIGGAKFEPHDGKCYTGAGQSLLAIIEMSANTDTKHQPVLVALYEGIYRLNGDFKANTHAGICDMHNILPGAILQIGYQLCIQDMEGLEALAKGEVDAIIQETAKRYKCIELPIFLRPGYEFSGEWNGYEPAIYKRAYRHFVDVFHGEGVENVAYIWNSHNPYQYNMFDWFPCDDKEMDRYVDWFAYNILTDKFDATWYIDAVAKYSRPVMIGEGAYGIAKEDCAFSDWCEGFFSTMRKHGVKGYQYINWDWHVYPEIMQWTTWKNGRYTTDEESVKAYNQYTLDEDAYVYRDESFYMPVRLYVDCARGLEEAKPETIWSKEVDHAWVKDGYAYEVKDAMAHYGDGFKPYWVSLGQELGIEISTSQPEAVNLLLWLVPDDDHDGAYCVMVNQSKTYDVRMTNENFVKIPIHAEDMLDGEVSISIACHKGSVQLIEMGVLGIAEDAPSIYDMDKKDTGDSVTFYWQADDGAYIYNIYQDYQLVDMTSNRRYTINKSMAQKAAYSVSATSIHRGEGEMVQL